MSKKLFGLWMIWILSIQSVFAQASSFMLETNPTSLAPNEAADLTIRALDEKWEVIKDFNWDIVMTLEQGWKSADKADYTLPQDWIYEFLASDKWVRTFEKWLVIRKAGSYQLKVEGVDWGLKTLWLEVKDSSSAISGTINITSPAKDSVIKNDSIEISWTSDFDNSPVEIFINDKKVADTTSDKNGDFSTITTLLNYPKWELTLQAKVKDFSDKYIAISWETKFVYDLNQNWIKSLWYTPQTPDTKTTVNFELKTEDTVNSATLYISWYKELPLVKKDMGIFTTDTLIETPGTYSINAKLASQSWVKDFENIASLRVLKAPETSSSISSVSSVSSMSSSSEVSSSSSSEIKKEWSIWNITSKRDDVKKIIDLEWTYTEKADSFIVQYWTSDSLWQQVIANVNRMQLTETDPKQTYFVKITWVFSGYTAESEVIQIPAVHNAASCKIEWIKLSDQVQNWKHYLIWSAAAWAKQYNIYTSDNPNASLNQMTLLTKTENTRFEYPYDPNAKEEQYKYYAVVADCEDWTIAQIDWLKKVKVWPIDTALMMFFISWFAYSISRVFRKY